MMEEREIIVVSCRLSKRDNSRLEAMAKRVGVTKSILVRNMVLAGMEDASVLDALGLFKLMRAIEGLREGLSAKEALQVT